MTDAYRIAFSEERLGREEPKLPFLHADLMAIPADSEEQVRTTVSFNPALALQFGEILIDWATKNMDDEMAFREAHADKLKIWNETVEAVAQ